MSSKSDKQRFRWGPLPVPAERANLYWGRKQAELTEITDGQLTAMIVRAPEFEIALGEKLDAIDGRSRTGNGSNQGRPCRWTARQLESVLVYRRVIGLETIKSTLVELAQDQEARMLLGFGRDLPSAATVTRYLTQHFDPTERARLYRELDRLLRQRVVALPGFDEEARILGIDGSQHGTRYTAPIPERKRKKGKDGKSQWEYTGEIVNAKIVRGCPGAITAASAGFVGGNGPKSGRGWQFVGLFTEHGTLVAWDVSPLNENERPPAERVFDNYETEILPHRGRQTLSVCTADGGFSSPKIRARLQALRIVPNIHKASHRKDFEQPGEETANASRRNRKWRPFEHPSKPHYSNWRANGHAEIRCDCQRGITKRVFRISSTGLLTIATKGQCQSCGNITVTAGQWRRAQNPDRLVRSYSGERSDPALGNPLTFNDKLSRAYGDDRYGFGESVHATINRRFGLLEDKSWMRDIRKVETEFAIAASAISVLLLERAARQQAGQSQAAAGPGAAAHQGGATNAESGTAAKAA
ncbi:MAG TPA: hypothetical protein VLL27_02095 [Solirubrobacterales bacterium]|nr:hypothetical protein [Solirubrobacterales bacterium]